MARYNPNHKWYYFPHMKNNEVLLFKQFWHFKGIDNLEAENYKCVFHSAFEDPTTPKNAEPR
jgi:hypothetical protein